MDPATGEILALANAPTFNPNSYARARPRPPAQSGHPGSLRARIDVQDRHRVGAALEEGLISPDDLIDVSPGMIRFGSRQIDDVHRYGVLSFTDVIVKSSNVGAIKVGLKLGPERLGPLCQPVRVRPDARCPTSAARTPASCGIRRRLDPGAVASVSMGYQVGVTPVQMATAVSSIANGGTLYEPRVVRAIDQGRAARGESRTRRCAARCPSARQPNDRDHGGRRRCGHGQGGADRRLHDCRQDGHGAQSHQWGVLAVRVQRLVRRLYAVAQAAR